MIRVFVLIITIFAFNSTILAKTAFKAAKNKKEVKLKLKADKKKKDEAKKRALEKIKQREKQKLDIYALTDDDIAEIEKKEKAINEKNQEQIKLLEGMLKKYADLPDDTKAERMFQLSELKWDISKFKYLRLRKEYEKKMDACFENQDIKCPKEEPTADYSESIKIYKDILKKLPRYNRIDEVIYYLGYGLQRAGKPNEAVSYFQKIIQKYKKSQYVPNAYLALGEFFFENNSFIAAKKNYLKVLENKDSDVYDLGKYKLAWTYYNLGINLENENKIKQLDKSVELFKYSIEKAKKALSFKNQAKNDLVLVMSEYSDAFLRVKNYFYKLGGQKESIKRLNNLGELLLAQGKDEQVIEVYRYLISVEPNGKKVPEYYNIVLESVGRLNTPKRERKVTREIIDFFAPEETWIRANKDKEYKSEGFEFARKLLQNTAITEHEKAQKCNPKSRKFPCNKTKLYLSAGDLYKEYIGKYPTSKEAYEDSFYYAEILFYHKKDWQNAANYYEKVFKDPSAKNYYADAAFGMILALEKLMKDEIERLQGGTVKLESSKEAGALDKKKQTQLSNRERQYIVACDHYLNVVKENKDTPKVHYGAARLLYERGHYKKSIKRFETIIKKYKGTKFASLAGNLILDTYNRLKNFSKIEKWAEILLKNKDFTYNKKDKLVIFVRQSILKQGEESVKAKKYHDAAEHFIRLANDLRFKNDMNIAPDALKKAAAAYGFAKDEPSANAVLLRLIKDYPKSPLAAESLFSLGNVHNMRAKFKEAADYFSKLENYPDNDIYTADALFNAINLYAALSDTKNAQRLITVYLDIYKKSKNPERLKDIEVLKLKRGEIYEFVKDYKKANEAYKTYIELYPSKIDKVIDLNIRIAKNILKDDKKAKTKAETYFNKALKIFKDKYQKCKKEKDKKTKKWKTVCDITFKPKKGSKEEIEFIRSKNLIGEILFMRAKKTYNSYIKLSKKIITTPSYKPRSSIERVMQKDIKKLMKLAPVLYQKYSKILDYQSPVWSVAATYRLAKIPHVFSETLFKAPLPKGLDEDEQFVYREMLDEAALPYQESALRNYETVLNFVQKHNWYNQWYRKAAGEIVKFEGKNGLFPAAKYSYKDKIYNESYIKYDLKREILDPVIEKKKGIKNLEKDKKTGKRG